MSSMTLVIGNRNYSSWSMRAWLAMRQTGAEFDEIVIPLKRDDTKANIRQHSPSGWVPALKHGALTVCDSLAISEYLHERFPRAGLWPDSVEARAVSRSVVAEMHSGFTALRSNMPMDCRSSWAGRGMADGVRGDIDRIVAIWENCRESFGEGGPFLFGAFSLADAFFAPVVSRFRTYGVNLEGTAATYAQAIWEQEYVREWVEGAEAEEWVIEWFF